MSYMEHAEMLRPGNYLPRGTFFFSLPLYKSILHPVLIAMRIGCQKQIRKLILYPIPIAMRIGCEKTYKMEMNETMSSWRLKGTNP